MLNALTVDVEEWFHISGLEKIIHEDDELRYESRVVENTRRLLEILRESKVKATFFVLGCVAQRYPDLILEIANSGHEIACHGFKHILVYRRNKEEFIADLRKAIKTLEEIIQNKILGYRAADFSITRDSFWALDILAKEGIKYDCSIFPIWHPRYGMPEAMRFPFFIKDNLMEFPLTTIRFLGRNIPISGGAYLRILPYGFVKRAIKKINQEGKPAQVYLHPWEIDPGQPRIKIPWGRRFTHYINLKTTSIKLKSLLEDFEFAPVREVLKLE